MKQNSKRKKVKRNRFAYIQGWGTYTNETIVAVGMNPTRIMNYMRRVKAKPVIAEAFLREVRPDIFDNVTGAVWTYKSGASVMLFPNWKKRLGALGYFEPRSFSSRSRHTWHKQKNVR
jgi:hypothetical protein